MRYYKYKLDKDNYITGWGKRQSFGPGCGVTYIDPEVLRDEFGNYNYKFVDGQVVDAKQQPTEEQKAAYIEREIERRIGKEYSRGKLASIIGDGMMAMSRGEVDEGLRAYVTRRQQIAAEVSEEVVCKITNITGGTSEKESL